MRRGLLSKCVSPRIKTRSLGRYLEWISMVHQRSSQFARISTDDIPSRQTMKSCNLALMTLHAGTLPSPSCVCSISSRGPKILFDTWFKMLLPGPCVSLLLCDTYTGVGRDDMLPLLMELLERVLSTCDPLIIAAMLQCKPAAENHS